MPVELQVSGVADLVALALAAVFVVAGVAKLVDRRTTARSFAALGLPRPDALAVAVPASELLTAVLLLVVPTIGALVALTLLAFFTAFLVRLVRAPGPQPCGCFGAATSHPASWRDVARNGALSALALVALFATPVIVV